MLSLLSWNIHHGESPSGRMCLEDMADEMRRMATDVILLQEVDVLAERSGRVDQPHLIATASLYEHFVFMPNLLRDGSYYGNAIFSHHRIVSSGNIHLPTNKGSEPRAALRAVIEKDGERYLVVDVHFSTNPEERKPEAEVIVNTLNGAPYPTIVGGDFNVGLEPSSLGHGYEITGTRDGDEIEIMKTVFHSANPMATYPSIQPVGRLDRLWQSCHLQGLR